jgi:hypothetical protein
MTVSSQDDSNNSKKANTVMLARYVETLYRLRDTA